MKGEKALGKGGVMLGIDINEIKEVKIEDAIFKFGIIPYGIKIKLDGHAMRFAKSGTGKIEEEIAKNPEEFIKQNADYVRYSVKGHSGIKNKMGNAIPFKADNDGYVSDETLTLYYHMGIIPRLSMEAYKFNTLTEKERKNS